MPDEPPQYYPQPTPGIPLPTDPRMAKVLMKFAKFSSKSKGHPVKAVRHKQDRQVIKFTPGKFY